jgi:hypothetical protein
MNIRIIIGAMLLIASGTSTAFGRSATFFMDGVLIEREVTAAKGLLEVPLPAEILPGSLRIKPSRGTAIRRVDILEQPSGSTKSDKELDMLLEQKSRLDDRLLALATREEIYKSAAKSQSGKAPRKTKTNPEPLQSIRQGTDFAIAQLEAVYTARRKTEQEIRHVDRKIASAKSGRQSAESVARVLVSPPRGVVTVRYATAGKPWVPLYDIFLNGSNSALVNLSGKFPATFAGYLLQASPSMMEESQRAKIYPLQSGPVSMLTSFTLPSAEESFNTGLISSFSFELNNRQTFHLPAGAANIYRNGEYVGSLHFDGLSSGRSRRLAGGK